MHTPVTQRPICGPGQGTRKPGKRRIPAFWVRQFHTWHWMSSAICLAGMVLFAVTGITLNHAGSIEAEPTIVTHEYVLPDEILGSLDVVPANANAETAVPPTLINWLDETAGVDVSSRTPEWSAAELYVPLAQPGGDGWVLIDRLSGDVVHETTDRGWIAYLNDLHKGRDTGAAWSWFIDIFAAASVIFSLTGLLLLQLHAKKRPSTWPIAGAGVLIPLFLILFLIH